MRSISVSGELLAFDRGIRLKYVHLQVRGTFDLIPKILDPATPSVVDETKTKYLGGQFNSEIDQEFCGYIFGKQEQQNVIFGDL